MTYQIKVYEQQLQLRETIIQNFIPQEEVNKIMSRAYWSDEHEQWFLPFLDLTGNSIVKNRPKSSLGLKKVSSEYARIARCLGDKNIRYQDENIIDVPMDMPDRTCEDYQN